MAKPNITAPINATAAPGGFGGGGTKGNTLTPAYYNYGSGGKGGNGFSSLTYTHAGGDGRSGAVWIEYFDPTL